VKSKLRRVVVDGATYLFSTRHRHIRVEGASGIGRRCEQHFTAYLAGIKASPLRMIFTEDETCKAGYPESGVVWTVSGDFTLNLNTPSAAAAIIRAARASIWDPEHSASPTVIEDGFAFARRALGASGAGADGP
jgi:hypothetical protein